MNGSQRGFTLLEVLIAVTITAALGVGAVQLLSSVANARNATEARSDQLAALQRFDAMLGRDAEQFINRPIRDGYGDLVEALLLSQNEYLIEFTRAGWRNRPGTEDPRAELQRIAFQLVALDDDLCEPARRNLQQRGEWLEGTELPDADCLIRWFWPVLDRSYDSAPIAVVVLDQVLEAEVSVLAETRPANSVAGDGSRYDEWYSSWPPLRNEGEYLVPLALRWTLTLPSLGEIERTWLIAHNGEAL